MSKKITKIVSGWLCKDKKPLYYGKYYITFFQETEHYPVWSKELEWGWKYEHYERDWIESNFYRIYDFKKLKPGEKVYVEIEFDVYEKYGHYYI